MSVSDGKRERRPVSDGGMYTRVLLTVTRDLPLEERGARENQFGSKHPVPC